MNSSKIVNSVRVFLNCHYTFKLVHLDNIKKIAPSLQFCCDFLFLKLIKFQLH